MESARGPDLGRRAARGAAWSYASYFLGRAVGLGVTALLARLLAPADFGVVALALVVVAVLETLADFGLNQSLVVAPEGEEEARAETVLVLLLSSGAVLAALTCLAAPWVAAWLDAPLLAALLPVLALTFVVRAAGGTPYALAQRRLDFRTRTVAELADVVVRGAAGVALALAGAGPWSLVLGSLAGAVVRTGLLWRMVGWRPTWSPSRAHLPQMLSFGAALTGVSLLSAVISNVDYLAVGRVLGTEALGYYTIALKLPELLILNVALVATGVLFPAFSASDPELLGPRLLRALHYTTVVCVPLGVLLAVLAAPLTAVLFGAAWEPAVPVLQVLAVYAAASALSVPPGSMYKALGRADVLLLLAVPRTAATVALVLLAVPHGLVAVAAVQAASALAAALVVTLLALRRTGSTTGGLLRALTAPAVAGAACALSTAAAAGLADRPWVQLLLGGTAGALAYGGVLVLAAPQTVRQVVGWSRRPGQAAQAPDGGPSLDAVPVHRAP